jgi:hypothetical protein
LVKIVEGEDLLGTVFRVKITETGKFSVFGERISDPLLHE